MEHKVKVAVFNDISNAQHAIDDALALGVQRKNIRVMLSDDEEQGLKDSPISKYVVRPGYDTSRSHLGGGIGGAVGGFVGSFCMFMLGGVSAERGLAIGLPIGILFGSLSGAAVGRWLPYVLEHFAVGSLSRELGRGDENLMSDNWRSMLGAAIGGTCGAIAGTFTSYVIGIPSIWFFISSGLYAAAVSIITGGLTGAMAGRGLAPRDVWNYEDLADGSHKIVMALDCSEIPEAPSIDDLLRRDGATIIKTA